MTLVRNRLLSIATPLSISDDATAASLWDQMIWDQDVWAVPNDIDADTVLDSEDYCPLIANTDQLDTDDDSLGDACDRATRRVCSGKAA